MSKVYLNAQDILYAPIIYTRDNHYLSVPVGGGSKGASKPPVGRLTSTVDYGCSPCSTCTRKTIIIMWGKAFTCGIDVCTRF